MKEKIKKYPILFSVVMFAVGMVMAVILMYVCLLAGMEQSFATGIGRILAAAVMTILFARRLFPKNIFRGFVLTIPMYGLVVFNVINHFLTGGGAPEQFSILILILGIAPGFFEEVIFRGIAVSALKEKYSKPLTVVIISAVVFSLSHLTNLVGGYWLQVMVQLVHGLVVGMVLGSVYYLSGDLFSVILAHAAIDISNSLFPGTANTPWYMFLIFGLFIAAELIYAVLILRREPMEMTKEIKEPREMKKGIKIAIGVAAVVLIAAAVFCVFRESSSLRLNYYMEDGPWTNATTEDSHVKVGMDGEYLTVKVYADGVYTVVLENEEGRRAVYEVHVDRKNYVGNLVKVSDGETVS